MRSINTRLERLEQQLADELYVDPDVARVLDELADLFQVDHALLPKAEVIDSWRFMEILPWLVRSEAPNDVIEDDLRYWRQQAKWGRGRQFLHLFETWYAQTDHTARYIDPLWHWHHRIASSDTYREPLLDCIEKAVIKICLDDDCDKWTALSDDEQQEYLRQWLICMAHLRHPFPDDANEQQILTSLGLTLKELFDEWRESLTSWGKPVVPRWHHQLTTSR